MKIEEIYNKLSKEGYIVLHDYFAEDQVDLLYNECLRVLKDHQKDRSYLPEKNKEGCSDDERIFYVEKYSKPIQIYFSDDNLFNSIARKYCPRVNKKTLVNRLTYEEGKIRNSGAGWHRDNHDCQFKAIMYLTDVKETNGCFRFITNSSKRHIGKPQPRKNAYCDTRYSDETIKLIVDTKKDCEIIDIIGKKGTVILVDTTYIHRGKVIEEGERIALTQYFF